MANNVMWKWQYIGVVCEENDCRRSYYDIQYYSVIMAYVKIFCVLSNDYIQWRYNGNEK